MMTGKWDLTPLYQSFDDPAFAADIAALPGMIAELNETIAQELPAVEKLEKLTSQQKEILRQFDGTVSGGQYEKKKSFFDKLKDAFS